MSNTEARTIEFHEAFGHPVRDVPNAVERDEAILLLNLIEEEYLELVEALFPGAYQLWLDSLIGCCELSPDTFDFSGRTIAQELRMSPDFYNYEPDIVEVADAVADLDVVVNGAGIRHGFDMQALSREAFRSNMTKLGADGRPLINSETGKIMKSPLFQEPDFAGVLGV